MQWVPRPNPFSSIQTQRSIDSSKAAAHLDRHPGTVNRSLCQRIFPVQTPICALRQPSLDELKNIAFKNVPTSLQNQNLVAAINRIECIQSNNSLLITGTTDAIEQIKTLIAEFDHEITAGMPRAPSPISSTKPKYLPAEEIQGALTDPSSDLQASGLADPPAFPGLGTDELCSTDRLFALHRIPRGHSTKYKP